MNRSRSALVVGFGVGRLRGRNEGDVVCSLLHWAFIVACMWRWSPAGKEWKRRVITHPDGIEMSIQWEFGGGWSNNVLRMITLYSAHNHCLWNCLFRPVYALSLPRTRFVCHPFSFILFLSVFFFFLLIAHPINTAVMSRRNQSGSPYVVCVWESGL